MRRNAAMYYITFWNFNPEKGVPGYGKSCSLYVIYGFHRVASLKCHADSEILW